MKKEGKSKKEVKMCKRLCLVLALAGFIILLSAGIAEAAFEVQNWGRLVYYSNVLQVFRYDRTDSAVLRILFGPEMFLAKNVRNEVTGDSDEYKVKVGRGDTVTFTLYSANNRPNADTTAHHVILSDTFDIFGQVDGIQDATVGPNDGINSFTYVPASEYATTDGGDSYCTPTNIAYYDGTQWEGTGEAVVDITDPSDPNWITYSTDAATNESNWGGTLGNIRGITWYWTIVECVRDDEGTDQDKPYKIQTQFQLKKNDN